MKTISFPVFHYDVRVCFYHGLPTNLEKVVLKYEHTKHTKIDTGTDALAIHVADDGLSYVFLHINARSGVIAHESWHVIRRMLDYVGADLENEVVAYHLGYLVNQIEKLRRANCLAK